MWTTPAAATAAALVAVVVMTTAPLTSAKCCMPDKWEAKYMVSEFTIDNGVLTNVQSEQDMVYDRTTKRIKFTVNETRPDGTTKQYIKLGLYAEEKEYIIDLADNSCVSQKATYFPVRCLPNNINVYKSSVTLGVGQRTLSAKLGMFAIPMGDATLNVNTVVTDDCIPVFAFEHKTYKSKPQTFNIIGSFYMDITMGIPCEDVFNVPANCH